MNDEFKLAYRLRTELPPEASGRLWSESLQATLTRREACLLLGSGFLLSLEAQTEPRLSSRLLIGDDGIISLLTGKMDMGQGSRTLLTQCVAEELRVPVNRVKVVMGDTGLCPDDGGTWASSTTPDTVPVIRRAAAILRTALLEAAGLPASASLDKTDLAALAKKAVWDQPANTGNPGPETPQTAWKVLGQSVPAVNGRDMVTGRMKFSSDLKVPGMLQARVLRPPAYTATVKSAAASLLRDGNTVAVLGPASAAGAPVEWDAAELPLRDAYFRSLKETARDPDPNPKVKYPALFDVGQAMPKIRSGSAASVHTAVYQLDPIAHVALEPRACLALFEGGKLTITSGTQAPFLVREDVARATGIPSKDIRIVARDTGSAYGGKQRGELETEAARIARLRPGVTVRVAWTRTEEFERAYFRPAGILEMKALTGSDGRIAAWEHHNYHSGASGLKPPYEFSDYWCGFHRTTEASLRHGSYRSLAAAANTFARESFIDECAAAASADPLDYRRRHISDQRLIHVARKAAEVFGWGKKPKGQGVSLNIEKGARVACMVRVEPAGKGEIRVVEAVLVGDFGAALNPSNLAHQLEGGFIQSIGFALFERIQWDSRRILNNSLTRYRVPRFNDVPSSIKTILVDRRDLPPVGAGEVPVTLAAPAIANAWFSLTGERRRQLPLNTSPV